MKLTDRARRDLQRYLERIRDSLAGQAGIDPEDVVEGVREHVEAAVSRTGTDPVTAEDLADILDRLGSPDQWQDADGNRVDRPPDVEQRGGAAHGTPRRAGGPWMELAPLVLAGAGGILVLVELTVPLGWALIAVGALTARLVVGTSGHRARRPSVSATLVTILWHLSAVAATGILVFLPALLVWSQSQIGGLLEPFLFEHTLPPGATRTSISGDRPPGFWPLVALLGGITTGAWWIVVGLTGRATADKVRRALGPAGYLATDRILGGLLVVGGFLCMLSLVLFAGASR